MTTRIEFFMCDKKIKKQIDINNTLNEIRTALNLSQNENFVCLEQNRVINYRIDEEYNTKLRVIIKSNKVYIGREIQIKQGNAVSA